MTPLRVFIGYDPREPSAYHVLSHSILRRASIPVSITPIARTQLRGVFIRERGPLESTDFSISRFLVPYLSGYEGFSIFLDSDMLCLTDIAKVMADPDDVYCVSRAVWVCQHDYYISKSSAKFLGQLQTAYPRKNWSSLMVFDNARCRALTPEYVNTATGLDLHQFAWLKAAAIGSLSLEWNHLVGEHPKRDAKIAHFTLGGPWFPDYADCEYAAEWRAERDHMLACG